MNVSDFLDELSVPFKRAGEHKNVRSGFLGINCPYCLGFSRSDYKFGVPENGGRHGSCWTCGPKTLWDVLTELRPDAKKRIAEYLHSAAPALRTHERPTGKYAEPLGVERMSGAHRDYLAARGFYWLDVERLWDVRGIGQTSEKTAWSLFIPVTLYGEPVSWTCRRIGPDHGGRSKYIAAEPSQESVHHKNLLYGADLARHSIVVVEGPTKVWAGGPGFVCTFGVSTTPAQVANIARFPRRCILFDSEPAAQRRARELARTVECFDGETFVAELESASQLDLADAAEVAEVRKRFLED